MPWKLLEEQGFIADATCCEIRLEMPTERRIEYALAERRDKFRIAAENPRKLSIVEELIANVPMTRSW